MLRNNLLGMLLLLSLSATAQETTTFIFTRHAEKMADGGNDPDLSEEGKDRATRISEVLEKVPVTTIYSTGYNRTRQTVAPTASSKELEITEYDPRNREFLNNVMEKEKGGTILISGHSNTIPNMINQLAKTNYPNFSEEEYDNLIIVIIKPENDPLVIWLTLK